MSRSVQLFVKSAEREDVYRDVVRINEAYRLDVKGKRVPAGSICSLKVGNNLCHALLRGTSDRDPAMLIDERIRDLLGVSLGEQVEAELQVDRAWGQFLWAFRASDPGYRIAARMAFLSVVLGVVGLVLGAISLIT